MAHVGLLHTGEIHVGNFAALFEEILPEAALSHLVREDLLMLARLEGGLTANVAAGTRESLAELAAQGAAVVLCTCSTLGPAVEAADAELGVPVLRIDRPLAEAAVAAGKRILVAATAETTLGPTRAILEDAARKAGRDLGLEMAVLEEAWDFFEAGDEEGYWRAIAEGLRGRAAGFDALVLAQASMAGAAPLLADLGIPVLSSPRLAVERTAELFRTAPT